MKNFIKRFLTVSVLAVSCLSSAVMAADNNTSISVTRINNLNEKNVSGSVVDSYKVSDSFIKQNEINAVDISDYDSIIISHGTENKISTKTDKVVYDTVEWTETVKANIKIGESSINGDKGKNTFNTATYIQADSQSSMYPVDAVSYLMNNLSIGEVKTTMGKNGNSVTIDYNGRKIEFTAGSDKVIIDNYAKLVDNGAVCEFNDGKLFIPLRSFSNAIDCKIDWVADGKIVNLEKSFARKSMVKRIETTEPLTETTTQSTPPISLKSSGCQCPSWCSCKKEYTYGTGGLKNINKTTIINTCSCETLGICNCLDNKGPNVVIIDDVIGVNINKEKIRTHIK